jgi:hypothetical protein
MCVKLIDVLSSHPQLIKIAVDPDVLTYLCSVILPRQMVAQQRKNHLFSHTPAPVAPSGLQYKVMSDNEEDLPQASSQADGGESAK